MVPPAAGGPAARTAAVTVRRPSANASPTNSTAARRNVRPVNAIENPDTGGPAARGSDTSDDTDGTDDTDDTADSFPSAWA